MEQEKKPKKNIVAGEAEKGLRGKRKKTEEEFRKMVKESRERAVKIEVTKNSNLLKKEE